MRNSFVGFQICAAVTKILWCAKHSTVKLHFKNCSLQKVLQSYCHIAFFFFRHVNPVSLLRIVCVHIWFAMKRRCPATSVGSSCQLLTSQITWECTTSHSTTHAISVTAVSTGVLLHYIQYKLHFEGGNTDIKAHIDCGLCSKSIKCPKQKDHSAPGLTFFTLLFLLCVKDEAKTEKDHLSCSAWRKPNKSTITATARAYVLHYFLAECCKCLKSRLFVQQLYCDSKPPECFRERVQWLWTWHGS